MNEHDTPNDADDGEDLGFELPEPSGVSARTVALIAFIAGAILAVAFFVGWLPRHRAKVAANKAAVEITDAVPNVLFARPQAGASTKALGLPATIEALEQTTIYPRADGYVKSWSVDMGDHVKEGQELAQIETPEINQQLLQALAQLAQGDAGVTDALTTRDLAKVEADRYASLAAEGLSSKQDLESRKSQLASAEAKVKVAEAQRNAYAAAVRRLQQLAAYAKVVAPFDGVIVERRVERGALLTAGTGTPLYKVARLDPVRVLIAVPQSMAPSIKDGQKVEITVREFPGRTFVGQVAHIAGALDPDSRTLKVEIRVPNADGTLLVGMYVRAELSIPTPHAVFTIPSNAVIAGADGTRVATIQPDNTIKFQKIVVEEDNGSTVAIASGMVGDERVVLNAAASLKDGVVVDPTEQPPKPATSK
ncbi:efflux RND transporter periplasmic adaptor subunit [soil metagenome]